MGVVETVVTRVAIETGNYIVRHVPIFRWFGYQLDRIRARLKQPQQPGWRLCPECRGTQTARDGHLCTVCQESWTVDGVPLGYMRAETRRKNWNSWQWQARPGTPGNWHPSIPADVLRQYEEKQKREEREYRELHKHERRWWQELI